MANILPMLNAEIKFYIYIDITKHFTRMLSILNGRNVKFIYETSIYD